MNKSTIGAFLFLAVTIPALALAAQSNTSTQASISGNTASVTVQSNIAIPNSLLDLELYNSSGNKIDQAFLNVDIPNGSLSCNWNMSAPAGSYVLKIGVFNSAWSTQYNWNNNAASASGPLTGNNSVSCAGAAAQPIFTSSASEQGGTAGSNGIFTTTVEANQNVLNVLVDTELYDASNNKIGQWFETDNLSASTPLAVTHQAVLPSAGNYTLKVGLFSSNWSTLYQWNNAAGAFVATSGGGTQPPPPATSGTINPSAQTVQPGSSVDFSGHNFGHEETVAIARNGTGVGSAHADGGGNFSTGSISMPNSSGTYVFTFTGQNSGIVGSSTIQIGPITGPQSNFSFSIANSNAVPPSQVLVNTNNQPLGAFTTTIQGEAIVLQGMNLNIATSSTGTGLLQNVEIRNSTGQIIGGPYNATYDAANGRQRVTFISPITFDLGTTTYKVVGELPAGFANGGTITVSTNPASDWGTAIGATSHTAQPLPNTTVSLNSMIVQNSESSSSLAVATDTSSPTYAMVSGGTTGVTMNVLKFRATNESIELQKIGLKLSSGLPQDVTNVYLYAGANLYTTSGTSISPGTLIGTDAFTGSNTTATSTLATPVVVPNNTDATIIVKADISNIGTNQPGIEGDLVAVDYLNAQGIGTNSGTTVFGSALSGSGAAGVRTFKTIPTISLDTTLPSTGVADGRLMEFRVTADSHGPLGINQFAFAMTTTTATVTNLQLFVYSDSGYSQAVSGSFGASTGQFGSTMGSIPSGSIFKISATINPIEVPAGATLYFMLRGSAASQTGSSVTTTLLGDSMFDGMKQAATISGNFIWSPNATGTAPFSQNDWTNGFGVWGLSASGITQIRTN